MLTEVVPERLRRAAFSGQGPLFRSAYTAFLRDFMKLSEEDRRQVTTPFFWALKGAQAGIVQMMVKEYGMLPTPTDVRRAGEWMREAVKTKAIDHVKQQRVQEILTSVTEKMRGNHSASALQFWLMAKRIQECVRYLMFQEERDQSVFGDRRLTTAEWFVGFIMIVDQDVGKFDYTVEWQPSEEYSWASLLQTAIELIEKQKYQQRLQDHEIYCSMKFEKFTLTYEGYECFQYTRWRTSEQYNHERFLTENELSAQIDKEISKCRATST